MDNCVENYRKNTHTAAKRARKVDINNLYTSLYTTFPLFFAEIRYKLSNFAPKTENVENPPTFLIFNKKELTPPVHNAKQNVENEITKKNDEKF